jgi:hypothetical protein
LTPAQQRWFRVVDALESLRPPDPHDAAWFVACHKRALEGGLSLESAYGLVQHGGAGGLARAEAQARRNTLLVQLYREFYFDLTPREAARAIDALAARRRRAMGAAAGPRETLMDAALLTGERIPKPHHLATILLSMSNLKNTL